MHFVTPEEIRDNPYQKKMVKEEVRTKHEVGGSSPLEPTKATERLRKGCSLKTE